MAHPFTDAKNLGFELTAIDLNRDSPPMEVGGDHLLPFKAVFARTKLASALKANELAFLWGWYGVTALLKQLTLPPPRRRVLIFSYVWGRSGPKSLKRSFQDFLRRLAVRFARGVVLMTAGQVEAARRSLPLSVPVIYFPIGVDQEFYGHPGALGDIPEPLRDKIERLTQSAYVILPGDELRLNQDALHIVERSNLALVRICQFPEKSGIVTLKVEIARRNLSNRLVIFERIDRNSRIAGCIYMSR